jgi:hypothetical protein
MDFGRKKEVEDYFEKYHRILDLMEEMEGEFFSSDKINSLKEDLYELTLTNQRFLVNVRNNSREKLNLENNPELKEFYARTFVEFDELVELYSKLLNKDIFDSLRVRF